MAGTERLRRIAARYAIAWLASRFALTPSLVRACVRITKRVGRFTKMVKRHGRRPARLIGARRTLRLPNNPTKWLYFSGHATVV